MIYKLFHLLFHKIERIRWFFSYQYYRRNYDIDKSFRFNGSGIHFYGDGKITCSKNSYIGRHSSIQAYNGCQVFIGENVSISHYVKIYTRNSLADQDFSLKKDGNFNYKKGDVRIENDYWIGANVFIKENVKIGSNSVVGANSVVTKNIPANSIAGGIPAKVIKPKSHIEN